MNASEFYRNFKEALDFVGVGFSGMDQAEVETCEGSMVVKANGKTASFEVEGEDEN